MKPLYEITAEIAALLEQTDEDGALLPGVEEQLDALQVTLEHKVEGCCKAVKNYEAEAAAFEGEAAGFRAEVERLEYRAKVANGRVLRLKNYMKSQLARLGIKSLDAGTFRVRTQLNAVASVEFAGDPLALPVRFQRIKIEIDKDAAREAAKAGAELPLGVIVERGIQLRIT